MKKNTIYIHAGWSKTGTSAIQNAINENTDRFKEKGILYPKSIQWNDCSHHKFALAFNSTSGYSSEFGVDEAVSALTIEFQASKCHSVILSSELSPFYFDYPTFNQFIAEHFENVVILFTVRRQSELVLSLFNQLVKDANVRYPGTLFSLSMANVGWMNFYQSLDKWKKAVGRENIKVFKYGPDIVKQFFDYFNVELMEDSSESTTNLNVSVPNQLLVAIKQINTKVTEPSTYRKNRDKIIEMFNNINDCKTPGVLFSVPEQRQLDRHYEHSNKLLAEEYFDESILFPEKQYQPVKFVPLALLKQLAEVEKKQ